MSEKTSEWILGIDTSSTELGIGLVRDGRPIAGYSRYVQGSHAEHIQHTIDFFLQENAVKPSDIKKIAVAVGPGSFTGLRIGIAFVKGFTFMRDAHVYPVSSLHSVALGWTSTDDRPLVVAFDARRDEVFWARFRYESGILTRETEDTHAPANAFSSLLRGDDMVITDTLGYARSTVFEFLSGRRCVHRVEEHPLQRGLACALAAARDTEGVRWLPARDVSPHYITEPYINAPAPKTPERSK